MVVRIAGERMYLCRAVDDEGEVLDMLVKRRRAHPRPRNAAEFNANLELLRHTIPPALWADLRQAGLLHPEAPVSRPA